MKAVSSGALGRLGAKANPMKELSSELVVEGITTKFFATGQAAFCGQKWCSRLPVRWTSNGGNWFTMKTNSPYESMGSKSPSFQNS
ncbi:hypothetical protein GWG65_35795 [Bradyrhizobium sp. CSA207]|uniref:hypothetical protein n=1 Tax=Bradyrhizobium sp. CSA207 TaxID=2698826 RepID=UPI0023AF9F11|nr:hypothetical protein [Bradyrhizobium sp. CSA207]MDE5446632.1 hypothetical protein [Bradyrhizobium sp. CSA207]